MQAVCDHRGNIIWYSGPHIGVTSDVKLFDGYTPPLDDGEKLLADKAYVGRPDELIVPFKKQRGHAELSERRAAFNVVHAWYRATIEHCFAFVKRSVLETLLGVDRLYSILWLFIDVNDNYRFLACLFLVSIVIESSTQYIVVTSRKAVCI